MLAVTKESIDHISLSIFGMRSAANSKIELRMFYNFPKLVVAVSKAHMLHTERFMFCPKMHPKPLPTAQHPKPRRFKNSHRVEPSL